MESLFQRTSSFDQPAQAESLHAHRIAVDQPPHGVGAKIGATHEEVDRWYRLVDGLTQGFDHRTGTATGHTGVLFDSLEQLRDELYACLY